MSKDTPKDVTPDDDVTHQDPEVLDDDTGDDGEEEATIAVVKKFDKTLNRDILINKETGERIFDNATVERMWEKRKAKVKKEFLQELEAQKKQAKKEEQLDGEEYKKHVSDSAKKSVLNMAVKYALRDTRG